MVLTLEQIFFRVQSGAMVLTANKRVARILLHAYGMAQRESGLRAWATPQILPWSAWLNRVWEEALYCGSENPPLLLSAAQEHALWEELVLASPDSAGLLQTGPAAREAARAWELARGWSLPFAAQDWECGEDARAFRRWAGGFAERCRAKNWLDNASLPDFVTTEVERGSAAVPESILLLGFDELTPQQEALWKAVGDAGCRVEQVELPWRPGRESARRTVLPGVEDEIRTAALWARGLVERGAQGLIGIIVPDLPVLRGRIERIFQDVFDPDAILPGAVPRPALFNISMGVPLAEHPVIHAALLALGVGRERLPAAAASALLRSPFFAGALEERIPRARLDASLISRGGPEVSLARISEMAARSCGILSRIVRRWRRQLAAAPSRQTVSGWARVFSAVLTELGWPGDRPLNSSEYQALNAWRDLLGEFAALDATASPMGLEQAAARLRRLAFETLFQPGQELVPVQILGMLETSGMRFDHLWILAMHQNAWPGLPQPNPFLPLPLQRRYGLPHASAARELAFARMVTKRLVESAPDVIFSHAAREQDQDLRPSPLVEEFPEVPAESIRCSAMRPLAEVMCGPAELESLSDETGPRLGPGTWTRGGARIFQFQAACPFRAFAELRLGASELNRPETGLTPRQRGIILHGALERLWRRLGSHAGLCSVANGELQSSIAESVAEALAVTAGDGEFPQWHLVLEQRRLEDLLGHWLDLERQRAPFTVLEPEQERTVTVEGITLRIKVDRIDRVAGGGQVIIDYKSGQADQRHWTGDRPAQPQLPLYCITNGGAETAAVLFAQLRKGELEFSGISAVEGVAPGVPALSRTAFEEHIADWRRVLGKLAREFQAGRAVVDPKEGAKTCKTCSLGALCRVAETETALWQ